MKNILFIVALAFTLNSQAMKRVRRWKSEDFARMREMVKEYTDEDVDQLLTEADEVLETIKAKKAPQSLNVDFSYIRKNAKRLNMKEMLDFVSQKAQAKADSVNEERNKYGA